MSFKEYQETRQRHPNMLLLFRIGDRYELYGEDAEVAGRLLNLDVATKTDEGTREQVARASFSHESLQESLRRLLQAGHRVAICDQVTEQPAQNSPPTLFDDVDDR